MQPRLELPTKGQINAIADIDAIRGLMDDVERSTVQMETDLEFRSDDDDWADRCRRALALHRYTFRLLGRRLAAVKSRSPKGAAAQRADDETDPLTLEVLANRPQIVAHAIETTDEIDERLAWIGLRINAVTTDREDEISLAGGDRDEGFLVASGNALRAMREIRSQLQIRRGQISKAQRLAAQSPMQETRERLFIDAAREALDRETYMAIWDRVDAMQQQDRAA